MALRGSLETALRTAACYTVLPVGVVAYSAAAVALASLGATRRRIDRVYSGFADLCLALAGTELFVRGLERAKPDQAYVVVANHESSWDPVGLVAALRDLSPRFLVKKELMKIPVFGRALAVTGNVIVDRRNTRLDVTRIQEQMEQRHIDVSMLFYAEGHRSRDGALQPFKKGAFATAIRYGLPVLPVGHAGAFRIWKPLSWRLHRGPMAIEVGDPIPVEGLGLDDRERLRDRTYEAVVALRAAARARLREMGVDPGGID
jgi:1-acyl-sn-glycerol-3-phosphate acyltransferase